MLLSYLIPTLARGSQAGVIYTKLSFIDLISLLNLKQKVKGNMNNAVKEGATDSPKVTPVFIYNPLS